jgi:TonB family protein
VKALVVRFPFPASARSRYYLISGALHVVFAAVLILTPLLRPSRAAIDAPLVVDVVGSLPAPAAAEARPEPAAAEPEPPRPEPTEGVRAASEDVPAKPKEQPDENKEPEPEPAPTSAPAKTPEQTAVGPAAAGGAITSLDLGQMEHAWYRDSVVAALQTAWARPVLAGAEENWEVTVAFEIVRDGSARNPRLVAPSGVPSLDRSALRAVADASPFPPLPASWREPAVTAQIVFRLYPGEP